MTPINEMTPHLSHPSTAKYIYIYIYIKNKTGNQTNERKRKTLAIAKKTTEA